MINPFTTVFTDTVDWNDPFGETDTHVSVSTVTIPVEEYEHLLRRVETAERMYADSKEHVAWLEKVLDIRHELWQVGLDEYLGAHDES